MFHRHNWNLSEDIFHSLNIPTVVYALNSIYNIISHVIRAHRETNGREIFLHESPKIFATMERRGSEERSQRWKMARRSLIRSVQVNACWECQVWTRSGREIYKLSFGTSRNSPGWKFTSQLIVISTRSRLPLCAASLTVPLSKVERSPDNVCLLSQSDTPERTRVLSREEERREKKRGGKRESANATVSLVEIRANVCREGEVTEVRFQWQTSE